MVDVYIGDCVYRTLTKDKKNTFFVRLPDDDDELNYYAIAHLESLAQRKGFVSAAVICPDLMREKIERYAQKKCEIICLSEQKVRSLVSYVLVKFTAGPFPLLKNMRMVSLENDTFGYKILVDTGAFDKEYIAYTRMLLSMDEYEELVRARPFIQIRYGD